MSDVRNTKAMDSTKKTEVRLFLLLTVFLAPILAIALVGVLGFSIWIFQMFAGPPGV